ncbi:Endonuclease/exonuclease/phosphatase, partial [Vararia minispora EC-137]
MRKWEHVNQLMRECRIGILAVQEAHLNQSRVDDLHDLFPRLLIIHSEHPLHPERTAGTAIVLNRDLVDINGVQSMEIIPGYAHLVQIAWHGTRVLTVLNIYSPSHTDADKRSFWEALDLFWSENDAPIPDIMLGDFNLVEEAIDRVPCRSDPYSVVEKLTSFKTSLSLHDGWRTRHPNSKAYSFERTCEGRTSLARLDRIYVSEDILEHAVDWLIRESPIPTDHKLVSFRIFDENVPYLGRGRYVIPPELMNDNVYLAKVIELGLCVQRGIDGLQERTHDSNPQILWKRDFKDKIIPLTRQYMKSKFPKTSQGRLQVLYKERDALLDRGESAEKLRQLQDINLRIKSLESKAHESNRLAVTARDWIEGGTPGKYFSNLHKDRSPRDILYRLRDHTSTDEDRPRYFTRSDSMARYARDYHDSRQNVVPNPSEQAILEQTESLRLFIERKLTPAEANEIDPLCDIASLTLALKKAKSSSAPGLDGIPYSLYQVLHSISVNTKNRPKFEVVRILKAVHDDVILNGVAPGSGYTDGWLALLYKKGEIDRVENYRPITCLNTDYKL